MQDSKIFIVGANGQLGTALRKKYPKAKYADIGELDITDQKSVQSYDWQGIECIINAAAYTNVDGAETAQGRVLAYQVNATAVAYLSEVANSIGAVLVHVSTDYVFDGTQKIHSETENLSPISVYGASKAAGDIACSLAKQHYILRTSWVIGEGKNFVRTMLELGQKGISPTVVSDQIGRLTFTSELVEAIDFLLTQNIDYGLYNLTNSGPSVSWAQIAKDIFSLSGIAQEVHGTSTADYYLGKEGIAPRPLSSTLDLHKIEQAGYKPKSWKQELKTYLESEKKWKE